MESDGSLIALIVSVQPAADSNWYVIVGGLLPITATITSAHFVLRIWRGKNGTFRGTIRRQGSDILAPFQCNEQIQRLVSEWLNL
jgi:hypothetical protein